MKHNIFMRLLAQIFSFHLVATYVDEPGSGGGSDERLEKAFDAPTLGSKLVTLREEQAVAFIDYMKDESAILKKARVERMDGPNKTIAKLFVIGDFLYPGSHSEVDTSKDTTFGSDTLELKSELVRGQFMVTDQELEDNIEKGKIGEKFMRMIGKKVMNELDVLSFYARKRGNPLTVNQLFDGFKYRSLEGAHIIDAADTDTFADRLVKREKFIKAIKAMPSKFANDAEFITSRGVVIDYTEQYTTIADSLVKTDLQRTIATMPYTQANLMRDGEPVLLGGGAATTTASVSAAGQKVIAVTSATGVTAGKAFVTDIGTEKEQVHIVASVSASNITMVSNIMYEIESGATFTEVTLDGSDALLTDPKNLIYAIQTGGSASDRISFEIHRIPGVGYRYYFKMRIDIQIENLDAVVLVKNLKVI
ncbi:hypothetical protein GW846_03195 [Candidatus Gracilibacteria bacterium]|nr:hypothetical protein [Candidatus Gracilibacteria bacterium]